MLLKNILIENVKTCSPIFQDFPSKPPTPRQALHIFIASVVPATNCWQASRSRGTWLHSASDVSLKGRTQSGTKSLIHEPGRMKALIACRFESTAKVQLSKRQISILKFAFCVDCGLHYNKNRSQIHDRPSREVSQL